MLRYRLISGIAIAGALLLGLFFLPVWVVWLLLLVVASLALLEFYSMMDQAQMPVFRVFGLGCGLGLITSTFVTMGLGYGGPDAPYLWETAVLAGTLLLIFVRQFPQKHNGKPLQTIGCTLLGIFYVSYLFNFITRLLFFEEVGGIASRLPYTGRQILLYLVVVVKMTDIGAYTFGRLFGRQKMFPRLSPKKTWEGFAGGVVSAVVASLIFSIVQRGAIGVVPLHWGHALVLGVLLALSGVVGDLFESLIKRASGTKDSSALIPGMGGLLDVLDSLLFGAPVLFLYTRVFLA